MINKIFEAGPYIVDELSWDGGFGDTKIFAKTEDREVNDSNEERYEKVLFPSYIWPIPNSDLFGITQASASQSRLVSLDRLFVQYNDQFYAVGKYAIIQNPQMANQNFSVDKFKDPTEIIKLLAGIAYLYPLFDHIAINHLIVGLSLEAWKKFKDMMKDMYSYKKYSFSVPLPNGQMREIKVETKMVTCRLQGNGAYWDKFFLMLPSGKITLSPEKDKLKKKRFGIVDVGAKTIDYFISQGMDLIYGTEDVFTYGMSRAYEMVSNQLNNCPLNRISDYYIEYLNLKAYEQMDPLFYKGEYYPSEKVIELCESAFKRLGNQVAEKILGNPKWTSELDFIDLIIVCGGGAQNKSFFNAFKAKFPNLVEAAADPQFANAKGYLKASKFERLYSKSPKLA